MKAASPRVTAAAAPSSSAPGPGRHERGFHADERGDALADTILEVVQVDEVAGGVRPSGDDSAA